MYIHIIQNNQFLVVERKIISFLCLYIRISVYSVDINLKPKLNKNHTKLSQYNNYLHGSLIQARVENDKEKTVLYHLTSVASIIRQWVLTPYQSKT